MVSSVCPGDTTRRVASTIAALLPEIDITVSYAGTVPLGYRENPSTLGDWESVFSPLYRMYDYWHLYVLGTIDESGESNRDNYLIYNSEDPCCFMDPYASAVKEDVGSSGVENLHVIVADSDSHAINPEIAFPLLVGEPANSPAFNVALANAPNFPSLYRERRSRTSCPFHMSEELASLLGNGHPGTDWDVYAYDGSAEAPTVEFSDTLPEPPHNMAGCRLEIEGAPVTPQSALDWRMGISLPVDKLRGRKVEFSAWLKSDVDMSFTDSYIYTNFGPGVTTDGISQLGGKWSRKSVIVDVPQSSSVAEFWYRLVIGTGTVSPGEGTIIFVPKLDLVD